MGDLLIAEFDDEIALERAVAAFRQLGLGGIDDFDLDREGYWTDTDPNDSSLIIKIQIGEEQAGQMKTILERSGGRMIAGSSSQPARKP